MTATASAVSSSTARTPVASHSKTNRSRPAPQPGGVAVATAVRTHLTTEAATDSVHATSTASSRRIHHGCARSVQVSGSTPRVAWMTSVRVRTAS